MRIGFDGKRYFHNATGLGNYSRDLLRIITHFYPKSDYVLYNLRPSSKKIQAPQQVQVVEPQGFFTKARALWRLWYVGRRMQRDRIDIYHGLSGEIPIGIPSNTKVVVTVHDLIFEHFPQYYSFFDRYIHRFKLAYAVRHSDVVVAISEQTKQDVLRMLPVRPQRLEVIYQGCADMFKKPFDVTLADQLRQKHALPESFILNVGTIEPRKNLITLLQALVDTPYSLVVVGKKTPYYKQVIKPFLEANPALAKRVFFLKNIALAELATLYHMATLFCYPSLYEGFGIPIIEALFSGTPVITHNEGCLPEAAGPGSVMVDAQQPEALNKAIHEVMEHPELRERMRQSGWQHAQQFEDAHIAQQWQTLYESL